MKCWEVFIWKSYKASFKTDLEGGRIWDFFLRMVLVVCRILEIQTKGRMVQREKTIDLWKVAQQRMYVKHFPLKFLQYSIVQWPIKWIRIQFDSTWTQPSSSINFIINSITFPVLSEPNKLFDQHINKIPRINITENSFTFRWRTLKHPPFYTYTFFRNKKKSSIWGKK